MRQHYKKTIRTPLSSEHADHLWVHRRAASISKDLKAPQHGLFTLPRWRSSRLKKSVFHTAIRLLNSWCQFKFCIWSLVMFCLGLFLSFCITLKMIFWFKYTLSNIWCRHESWFLLDGTKWKAIFCVTERKKKNPEGILNFVTVSWTSFRLDCHMMCKIRWFYSGVARKTIQTKLAIIMLCQTKLMAQKSLSVTLPLWRTTYWNSVSGFSANWTCWRSSGTSCWRISLWFRDVMLEADGRNSVERSKQ